LNTHESFAAHGPMYLRSQRSTKAKKNKGDIRKGKAKPKKGEIVKQKTLLGENTM